MDPTTAPTNLENVPEGAEGAESAEATALAAPAESMFAGDLLAEACENASFVFESAGEAPSELKQLLGWDSFPSDDRKLDAVEHLAHLILLAVAVRRVTARAASPELADPTA